MVLVWYEFKFGCSLRVLLTIKTVTPEVKETINRGVNNSSIIKGAHRVTMSDHLIPWLNAEHSHKIAHSTLVRYLAIAKGYIVPALGQM